MCVCTNCQLSITNGKSGSKPLCDPCLRYSEDDPSIRMTPIEQNDLELMLAWRSNPEIYRHFRQQEEHLDWEDHVTWFESRADDRHDFVIHYEERRVGVVTIDRDDMVGIYLGDFSARGNGIATQAIKWLCDRFEDRRPLFAEIDRENDSSKYLFHRCGFQPDEEDGRWLIYINER